MRQTATDGMGQMEESRVTRVRCSECGDGFYAAWDDGYATCMHCGHYVTRTDVEGQAVADFHVLAVLDDDGEYTEPRGNYVSACAWHALEDGLPRVQRALWDAGYPSQIQQTGGFCMVLVVPLHDSAEVVTVAHDGNYFLSRMPLAVWMGDDPDHDTGEYVYVPASAEDVANVAVRIIREGITLDDRIRFAKEEIRADISNGRVPASVATFSELHDYTDANGYGGLFGTSLDGAALVSLGNALQSSLDAWLRAGRPDDDSTTASAHVCTYVPITATALRCDVCGDIRTDNNN